MALYTETLYDYLKNGHVLPSIFDTIPKVNNVDFKTLFTYEYSEWELGFETEESFERKLEAKALEVVPDYVEKINQINARIKNVLKNQTTRRNFQNNEVTSTLNDQSSNSAEQVEFDDPNATLNAFHSFQNLESTYKKLLKEFIPLFIGVC